MTDKGEFEIWVELDAEVGDAPDEDEFCNAIIEFGDGNRIGLNIWSEKFFLESVQSLDWFNDQVAMLPDLVIRSFDSASIKNAITKLVLEDDWLEGRGFPVRSEQ